MMEENNREDLIKRNLAISYATSGLVRRIDGEDWIRISEVKQSLNDVPTVPLPDFKDGYKQAIIDGKTNYSRLQGEWNYFAEEIGGIRMTGECPNCKQRRILDNFCSNCGADMRKEEK